jgi:hypothetical protein
MGGASTAMGQMLGKRRSMEEQAVAAVPAPVKQEHLINTMLEGKTVFTRSGVVTEATVLDLII